MASLYSALKRRRLAFSGTSGSGGPDIPPGSTLVRGAVIVTVMSPECSLSPSSLNTEAEVSQLMLAGRARTAVQGCVLRPLCAGDAREHRDRKKQGRAFPQV